MIEMTKEELEDLKRVAISTGEKIEQSSIFLSLLSESYKTDPTTALQLGIAILLDKPIGIIAVEGAVIPKSLQKLAFSIDEAKDAEEIKGAVIRVLQAADKLGVNK